MEDKIIKAAKSAIQLRTTTGTVSQLTKNAQLVAKEWIRESWDLDPNRIVFEESIHPDFNERIDLIDKYEMIAYEFKVSGKNAANEFFKDIVKIIVWNGLKPQNKIKRLVFITELSGRKYLDKKLLKPI